MKTESPSWELRDQRCTCCGGQGELVFSTCPACGVVVLICTEVGTVFSSLDRQPGSVLGGISAGEDVCARCGKTRYADFRNATADEILALGFQPRDYQ